MVKAALAYRETRVMRAVDDLPLDLLRRIVQVKSDDVSA
jgi:hypothetical protein